MPLTFVNAVLVAAALQVVFIPWFGYLSDALGRRPVYRSRAAAAALLFHAAMYGPQALFIREMFRTRVRYTGASMGDQLAGIVGDATVGGRP